LIKNKKNILLLLLTSMTEFYPVVDYQ